MTMQKKSLLALLLALMMLLSGCALVSVDTEKDNARTIVDVNGETVNKQTIYAAVQNQIQMNQYYNQLYASIGMTGSYSTDEATVTAQVIESYVNQLVSTQKAKELGLYEMTEEEKAEIETNGQDNYNSFLDSVASTYMPGSTLEGDELRAAAAQYAEENKITTADGRYTLDDFIASATDAKAIDKLQEYLIKDVAVTAEEVQADFDAKVESAKADYETNPDNYGYSRMNGSTVYYAPAGYRMVKHILVPIADEDSTATADAQTALNDAQAALDAAAEDADKDALQAAVDAAQAAYDEAQAAGFANAKAKADEIYALATAEDADFDALIAEYSTDSMPEEGYAIREGFAYFVEPFVTGAMALQNVGDVSEPVESTYGYHTIKYVGDVEEGPVDIETVRASIESALLTTKQDEATSTAMEQFVSEATVKTYADRMN
jgi:parvulin-like peptidyl-prolyl isomerase